MGTRIDLFRRTPYTHLVALLIVLAPVVWIFFPTHAMIGSIGRMLPIWALKLNLWVQPLLIPLAALPDRMRPELRLLSFLLFLCSLSLSRLSWDTHPIATAVVLVMVYVEAFWLIPKWNSRRANQMRASAPSSE